ncbi:putative lipase [Aspergillus undulatus]|uniref:putative lipase n=1 Tax=Aspergillus undulatus TaxID=1810928 RepID=UPI003CCD5231
MALITSLLAAIVVLIRALIAAADPLPPTIDPFYKPQDDSWKDKAPGFIIDHRPSPLTAHQLLFVTRNATGDPTTSVTTVIRPQYANPNRLLSYQIAYDSPDVNYYEGNNAAFTVGPQSGSHTLDSIRAALNSQEYTDINPKAKAVMFAYSGGGLASEWAAELYAKDDSDLNIVGAAIGGPPPNVTETYIHVNGTQSPLNVWAILGVMNAFPRVDQFLRDDLKVRMGLVLPRPPHTVQRPGSETAENPSKRQQTSSTRTGSWDGKSTERTGRSFPLYIFQGTDDNITAPIDVTDDLYWTYCHAGTNVRYVRYEGKDHGQTLIAGMYPAWNWISARVRGRRVLDCSVKNVTKDDDGDEDDVAAVDLGGGKTGLKEESGQDTLTGLGSTYEDDL